MSHSTATLIICTYCVDGILMCGLQLSVVPRLPFEIHLTEQIKSRFLASTAHTRTSLCFDQACKFPAAFAATKAIWFAVLDYVSNRENVVASERKAYVACSNDLRFSVPD